jgi:hypothetical protein
VHATHATVVEANSYSTRGRKSAQAERGFPACGVRRQAVGTTAADHSRGENTSPNAPDLRPTTRYALVKTAVAEPRAHQTIETAVSGRFIIFASFGQRDDSRKRLPSGPFAKTSANGSRALIVRSYKSAACSDSEHTQ